MPVVLVIAYGFVWANFPVRKSLRMIGKTKGVPMGTPFYPKSAIRACLYFAFRRVDLVWLLMSNSELLRIKNGQKTPYKKQKTASSHKKIK